MKWLCTVVHDSFYNPATCLQLPQRKGVWGGWGVVEWSGGRAGPLASNTPLLLWNMRPHLLQLIWPWGQGGGRPAGVVLLGLVQM